MEPISRKNEITAKQVIPSAKAPAKSKKIKSKSLANANDALLLSGSLSYLSKELKPGERVKIKIDGKDYADIIKTEMEPTGSPRKKKDITSKAGEIIKAGFTGIQELSEQDPSFTFSQTARVAKETILIEAPQVARDVALNGLFPTVRVACLLLDINKAALVFHSATSTLTDKIISAGRVITDTAGVLGAIPAVFPFAAPAAPVLMAVALVGDIVGFTYRGMRYVQMKAMAGAVKENTPKPQQPPPELQIK